MVIMPNHIHGILWIDNDNDAMNGGIDDTMGCSADDVTMDCRCRRDAINRVSTATPHPTPTSNGNGNGNGNGNQKKQKTGGITGKHNPMNQNNISRVIRWYKRRCTFETNKLFGKSIFAWQPRFHDRIIRDENKQIS